VLAHDRRSRAVCLPLTDGVDRLADSTDVLQAPPTYRRLMAMWPGLYRAATLNEITG
jgi:hypothetical protein